MRIRLIAPSIDCSDNLRGGQRFIIDIDEDTGDARIVNESHALIDRDSSAMLAVLVGDDERVEYVRLEVEAA